MDAFSFHPYPNRATDALDRGYAWPNAGFANLDRIKQAFWDAFHGTPQPTTVEGLKLHLDEVGWQVGTSGRTGYTGKENVPVTDEVTQALIYGDLIRTSACDPEIAELSFFGFRDDGARAGFQAGLRRLDGTLRPAADAVSAAIGQTGSGCATPQPAWVPGAEVVGAHVDVLLGEPSITVKVAAGEDARATVCAGVPASVYALVGLVPRPHRSCRKAIVPGLHALDVSVHAPVAGNASVEVTVDLRAESNHARRTRVVREAALGG
jgi:hypothetical protein